MARKLPFVFILKKMGFRSWQDYLDSEHWQRIRYRVLKRDNFKCNLCGDCADVVHHVAYDWNTLIGDNDDNLYSLCYYCHKKIHFHFGVKLKLWEANKKLEQFLALKEHRIWHWNEDDE